MPRIGKKQYGELEDVGDDSFSVSSAGLLKEDGKGRCLNDNEYREEKETRIIPLQFRSQNEEDHGGHSTTLSSSSSSSSSVKGCQTSHPIPHTKRFGLSVRRHRNRSESRSGSPTSDTGSRRRIRQAAGDGPSVDVPRHVPFVQLDLSSADEKEIVIGWVRNSPTSEIRPHSKPPAHELPPLYKPPRVDSDRKSSQPSERSNGRYSDQKNATEGANDAGMDASTQRLMISQKKNRRRKLNTECLNVSSEMEIRWHRNGTGTRSIPLVETKPSSESSMKSYIPAHLRVYQGKTVLSNNRGNRQNVMSDRKPTTLEGHAEGLESIRIPSDGMAIIEVNENATDTACRSKKPRDSVKRVSCKVGSNIHTSCSLRKRTDEASVKDIIKEADGLDEVNRGTLKKTRGRRVTKNNVRKKPSASPRRQDGEEDIIISWRRIRETLEGRRPQRDTQCSRPPHSRPTVPVAAGGGRTEQVKRNRSFDTSRQRRQPRRNRSFDGTASDSETVRLSFSAR